MVAWTRPPAGWICCRLAEESGPTIGGVGEWSSLIGEEGHARPRVRTCGPPAWDDYPPRVAKSKNSKGKPGGGSVASNRYASYRYELLERFECGIVLLGTEVKALRTSGAQLKDGYAAIHDGELWLQGVHIPPYGPAARENHDPERERKLLLHRGELDRMSGLVAERGLTLVPTSIYFKGPRAKVEIALARGKDLYDKRHAIRERESKRDMERGLREARR